MQTATETRANNYNDELVGAMATAREAVQQLDRLGIPVIAIMANGRRPLLMVDRIPDGVVSVIKRSNPNGHGGTTVVRATQWNGCQLEAMHDTWPDRQRAVTDRFLQVAK